MHEECIGDLVAVTEESDFKAVGLCESHLLYVLMVDSFVWVEWDNCVVTVHHFALTMLIGHHQSPTSIIMVLIAKDLKGWFLSLFDPILS